MASLRQIFSRDDNDSQHSSTPMVPLAVTLAILLVLIIVLGGVLFYMRRLRQARKQQELPLYNEKRASIASTNSSHRRVMARPSQPIYVIQEKQALMKESNPPDSPLPEIRITFPEEYDDSGKRTSGRCVVVRVGEQGGVGLEPVTTEDLPAYQEKDGARFHSLDLDRIGGLVEKARNSPAK